MHLPLRHRLFSRTTVEAALTSSAVAGTLLNLVNQGDALWAGRAVNWWRVALTYCVPYLVATFGAVRASTRAHDDSTDQRGR